MVLFDPIRDANPFFHFMEAIWMLAGDQNVAFPAKYASQIKQYSDDGVLLNGAYGWRWRKLFDFDQIEEVVDKFKRDPNTRRAVISMYDPDFDGQYFGKDLPCNTHLYFRNASGRLDMTVCNRSNDLVWGMLGSNIVTFSVLQEYIANSIGMPVGALHQFTNNLHVYEGWEDRYFAVPDLWYGSQGHIPRIPFSEESLIWQEAEAFVEDGPIPEINCSILTRVASPMWHAWEAHKEGDDPLAFHYCSSIYNEDWKRACTQWLERRIIHDSK
jgi:hypothetical protein